ncbi:MAG: hypothetical protein QXG97_02360 [Nitrososphaerota archaeon]
MSARLPKIEFHVHDPKNKYPWLSKKRDYLALRWEKEGQRLLNRIVNICGLRFPNEIRSSGIKVILQAYSEGRRDDSCGFMFPNSPARIYLYIKRGDSYNTIKPALCHEIIHCLVWSCELYDKRRKEPTLFEDFFADELITTLLEELVIKGTPKKVDVEWALDYARREAYQRLRDLKRHKEAYERLRNILLKEITCYQKQLREGIDAITERRKIVNNLPSPV